MILQKRQSDISGSPFSTTVLNPWLLGDSRLVQPHQENSTFIDIDDVGYFLCAPLVVFEGTNADPESSWSGEFNDRRSSVTAQEFCFKFDRVVVFCERSHLHAPA